MLTAFVYALLNVLTVTSNHHQQPERHDGDQLAIIISNSSSTSASLGARCLSPWAADASGERAGRSVASAGVEDWVDSPVTKGKGLWRHFEPLHQGTEKIGFYIPCIFQSVQKCAQYCLLQFCILVTVLNTLSFLVIKKTQT